MLQHVSVHCVRTHMSQDSCSLVFHIAVCRCARTPLWLVSSQVVRQTRTDSLFAMPRGSRRQAFNIFVATLRPLLKKYGVLATLNQHTTEDDARRIWRSLLLKAHPDKGGAEDDFKTANQGKEGWDDAGARRGGRPKRGQETSEKHRSGARGAADSNCSAKKRGAVEGAGQPTSKPTPGALRDADIAAVACC